MNIEDVYSCHIDLLGRLEKAGEDWPFVMGVGKIFLSIVRRLHFKMEFIAKECFPFMVVIDVVSRVDRTIEITAEGLRCIRGQL